MDARSAPRILAALAAAATVLLVALAVAWGVAGDDARGLILLVGFVATVATYCIGYVVARRLHG